MRDSGCLSLRVSGTATAASQRCGDTPTQRLDPDSFLVEQDFLIWSMANYNYLFQ